MQRFFPALTRLVALAFAVRVLCVPLCAFAQQAPIPISGLAPATLPLSATDLMIVGQSGILRSVTVSDTQGQLVPTTAPNFGIVAAGTTLATATPLPVSLGNFSLVSTVTPGTGVILSAAVPLGQYATVQNEGASNLTLYPPATDVIDGQSAGAPLILPAKWIVPCTTKACGENQTGGTVTLFHFAAGRWRSTSGANAGNFDAINAYNVIATQSFFAAGVANNLTSAGNSQSTALDLTITDQQTSIVAWGGLNTGVSLLADTPLGGFNTVINKDISNYILVYPVKSSGDQIDGRGGGIPIILPAGQAVTLLRTSTNNWRTISGAGGLGTPLQPVPFSGLLGQMPGALNYCTDCLKPGQTAGNGTGMLVFRDATGFFSSAGTPAAH